MKTFRRKKKPKLKGAQDDVDGGRSGPEDLFLKFIRSEDFTQIRETFKELCLGKRGVGDGVGRVVMGGEGWLWVEGSPG